MLTTKSSSDTIARAMYHYCPSRDVVVRQELIPEHQFKVTLRGEGNASAVPTLPSSEMRVREPRYPKPCISSE